MITGLIIEYLFDREIERATELTLSQTGEDENFVSVATWITV